MNTHKSQIESLVQDYAPLVTLETLQLRQDSAFVAVWANGERHAEFFTEETVEANTRRVKEKIRNIYLTLAN